MATQNRAAYITGPKAHPLEVRDAPFPSPGPDEVLIRSSAAAVNPVDWKIQSYDFFVKSYPYILGVDIAGTVHSVGSSVKSFAPGDRVLAHLNGLQNGDAANNGFQLYAKTSEKYVSKIPSSLAFTDAAVLPLAISTAAAGLYQKDFLNLPKPVAGGKAAKTGTVVLVWGGSSSVGSTAIQLLRASGVEVATTASKHNHEYVKELGAKWIFDHTSEGVVDEIVSALKGEKFAGVYDSIGLEQTQRAAAEVASNLEGVKLVAAVLPPPEKGLPEGVTAKGVFALSIDGNEVGPAVWGDFVPKALADGSLKAKPDALVIGKGLEKIQEGMDKNKAGVSAKKVVIELP